MKFGTLLDSMNSCGSKQGRIYDLESQSAICRGKVLVMN